MDTEPQLYSLPWVHEPVSAITHYFGALVFLALGIVLLVRGRNNPSGLVYLGVYAASVVLLMTMSGLYHTAVRGSPAHQLIGRLDHGAIFVLIAGTFTPAHGILFKGPLRWGPLIGVWLAASAGIVMKTVFYDDLPDWIVYTFFFTLGWFGLFTGAIVTRRYGFNFAKPLLIGGIAYSVGGVLDYLQWPQVVPGLIHQHELLHMAVLMGAFWHWLFIWQFAGGDPAQRGGPSQRGGPARPSIAAHHQ